MSVHRRVLLSVVAVAFVIGGIVVTTRAVMSQATFSDSEQLGVNRVGAASVGVAAGDATVELDIGDMAPGDSAVATIELVNDGSLPMRYAVASEFESPTLADHLTIDVWVDAPCGPAGSPDIPDGARVLVADVPLGGPGEIVLLGDPATGEQQGDRLLGPGSVDVLCYAIRLPRAVDNVAQGLAARQILTVYVEQDTGA